MGKSNNKLSLGTKLTFGIGDFYGGASCSVIALLFVVFVNTVAGISIGTAGLIVLAGKAIR